MNFPDDDRSPLIRTDFSSDETWRRVVDAVSRPSPDGFLANLHIFDDPRFEGADPVALAEAADTTTEHVLLVIADSRTMADPELSLLCVDPVPPGGQFRVVPTELWGVENNVSLANMDFADFAEATDPDGVFRGFSD